jgi:hypothetical protein
MKANDGAIAARLAAPRNVHLLRGIREQLDDGG